MNNTQEWIAQQRTYNAWLWGLVALVGSFVLAVIAFTGLGYWLAGKEGAYVVATALGIMGVLAFSVAMVKWLFDAISRNNMHMVEQTTRAIVAHQAADDRGEVLRQAIHLRHTDNQTAMAIHRQANQLATERMRALRPGYVESEDPLLDQFDFEDADEEGEE